MTTAKPTDEQPRCEARRPKDGAPCVWQRDHGGRHKFHISKWMKDGAEADKS